MLNEIADFLAVKRAENLSSKTIRGYDQQLKLFVTTLPPDVRSVQDVRTEHCAAFLAQERERKLKPTTIAARYRVLRLFFNWRRDAYGISTPLTFKPPKLPRQPPRRAANESVEIVISSIQDNSWIDLRDRAMLRLLHATGLRVTECASLQVRDINITHRLVYVRSGKGDQARYVPFSQQVAVCITAYLFNRPLWGGPELFLGAINRYGRPEGGITASGIRQILKRRCRQAGVDYINPHALRHLFATKALNDGIPLSAVSWMLGHSSTDFTARVYAKWLTDGLTRIYDEHWK